MRHEEFWDIMQCSPFMMFRKNMSLPSSGYNNKLLKKSARKQAATRPNIPEDRTLHNHRCENLKSYTWDKNSVQLMRWLALNLLVEP
jgi:hypothetical protein